jgi:serine/threonine protein kinase/Tol biopolymer transport system component
MTAPLFTKDERRTLEPGARLGAYEIVHFLAAGGMSEVYLARDTRLRRNVAVKVLPSAFGGDRDRIRRFEQEIRATSQLNHPNILSIYDVGESGSVPYFVTELLEGKTLRAELEHGAMPLSKALRYAEQIGRGLAAAHEKGIVHRDLKPANIFITSGDHLKILDFGLAKVTHPEREKAPTDVDTISAVSDSGKIVGSVGYMAPEQVHGTTADHRSDIFAFGAILYEMLSGRRAFNGDSPVETMHAILKTEPQELRDVPAPLARVVARCLAKSPNERFQSARDLSFALSEAAQSRIHWPMRPSRLGMIAGGIVAVVIVASVVLALRSGGLTGEMQTIPLSDEGSIRSMAVSPDRRFLAYVAFRGMKKELRLREIATGAEISLVPASEYRYLGEPIFSPDGNFVYYGQRDEIAPPNHTRYSLHRTSILGGDTKTIADTVDTVDNSFAISPDGKQIAFAGTQAGRESILYLVDPERGEKRQIFAIRYPEGFYTLSWSGDGRTLAASNMAAGLTKTILTLDIATHTLHRIATGQSFVALRWLPNEEGLIGVTFNGRLAHISYPEGRVTYVGGADARFMNVQVIDRGTLAAVSENRECNLWTMDASSTVPKRISTAVNGRLGAFGLAWASMNRIVFTKSEEDHISVWSCDPNGENQAPITHPQSGTDNDFVAASPDGRTVVFSETIGGFRAGSKSRLVKIGIDGMNPTPLTSWEPFVGRATFTPDGKFIIYTRGDALLGGRPQAYRIPSAGGTPVLIAKDCGTNDIDPSGQLLACCSNEAVEFVISLSTGAEVWREDLPAVYPIRWLDSEHMAYIHMQNGTAGNLWLQPIHSGSPKQITTSNNITNFAFSPDRRNIVLSIDNITRTPVLMTNVPIPHPSMFEGLSRRVASMFH